MKNNVEDMAIKKICVIGGGSSGLTAIKCCKEENFDVVCYEKTTDIGGLWRYHDTDIDGFPSVMQSTIINSSKEMSAFSDFPPPKHFANYMHNSCMIEYFQMYADKFDLVKHIQFNHEVIRVEKAKDYDVTGRLLVTVKRSDDGVQQTKWFDGVMICVGHHVYPNVPNFPGDNSFLGQIIHTHSLKSAKGFEGQRVLVIGIGNSGVDAAVELSSVTKKLYLSSRHGSWILSRIGLGGMPVDLNFNSRIADMLRRLNPMGLFVRYLQHICNGRFDHAAYSLKPKHSILSAHPTISDDLPNRIISGRVVIKQHVARFTNDGVIFCDEDEAVKIDAVILATGYTIKFPFLDEGLLTSYKNHLHLYKMVFPPQLPKPSLAFIGYIQPWGPIFPIAEAQSRWYVHLMKNKLNLPTAEEMEQEIGQRKRKMSDLYVSSPRHTIQVFTVEYMDDICSEYGAKPSIWWLALRDPKLFFACFIGPCTSYQYRLYGPHVWSGARDAILSTWDRIQAPLNTCIRK